MNAATIAPPSRPLPLVLAEVEVVAVERLSPAFVRLHLGGPAVADIGIEGPFLDQRFKLVVPGESGRLPRLDPGHPDGWYAAWLALPEHERGHMRTYTVRSVGPGADGRVVLTVDIVVHDHGPAGPGCLWARTATAGDRVVVAAPRRGVPWGGIEFEPRNAGRILLVGDETAVPAVASIVESLPVGTSGAAYLEVPGHEDVLEVAAPPGFRVVWLPRHDRQHGSRAVDAVSALFGLDNAHLGVDEADAAGASAEEVWETPTRSAAGETVVSEPEDHLELYAWVAGESGMVRRLRRLLVDDAGLARDQVAFMGYWRRGVAMRG